MIIIIIAFKDAVRDSFFFFFFFFYSLLSTLRTVSNTYTQVAKAQSWCKSRATHRAVITCNMLCARWYEGTAQLLSLTELKSHLF